MTFEQKEILQFIDESIDHMLMRPKMYGNPAMVESMFIVYMSFYDYFVKTTLSMTCNKYRKFSINKGSGALGLSSLYPDVDKFVEALKEFREEHMRKNIKTSY